MGRDPDEGGVFVFDLVDDEAGAVVQPLAGAGPAGADGSDGSDGDDPGAGGPPPSDGLSRRWRQAVPIAGVLAVVLGTGMVVDGMREADRMEQVRAVSGGVVDVSAPLEEVWEWEGAVGQDSSDGLIEVADLQGTLAFESGGELVGLDPASGEEIWTVPLGEAAECGPTGVAGWTKFATSVLVCLQGSGPDQEAVVVGPDGDVSSSRALDPDDTQRYGVPRPGPAGTVLRAKRAGPRSEVDLGDARCTPMGDCTGTVAGGRDLVLRAEDVATGEERWSVTVPFRATDAEGCTPWFGMPWDGSDIVQDGRIAPDAFGAQIREDLVDLWGCGVSAAVTPEGVVLRMGRGGPAGSQMAGLGAGGYMGHETTLGSGSTNEIDTMLFSSEGEAVGEIPGYAIAPVVAYGPGPVTLLGTDASQERLLSYAADGTERWDVPLGDGFPYFFAQVDGTAVAATWTAGISGLDLATGAERWTWDPSDDLDGWTAADSYVRQGFTDGRFLLLFLQNGAGNSGLASLDVVSGELLWAQTDPEMMIPWPDATLVAVDGHLLEVASGGVHGFG